MVGPSSRPEFGDYQANGVMAAAKTFKTDPRKLAEQLVASADLSAAAENVQVAGPGFVNVRLRDEWIAELLAQMGSVYGMKRYSGEPPDVYFRRLCLERLEAECLRYQPEFSYYPCLLNYYELLVSAAQAKGDTQSIGLLPVANSIGLSGGSFFRAAMAASLFCLD